MARFVLVPALFCDADASDELLQEAGVDVPKKVVRETTALNLDLVRFANPNSDGMTRVVFGHDDTGLDQLTLDMKFCDFWEKYLKRMELIDV